jgi:hypoxanthine phosphoribosyltransferase
LSTRRPQSSAARGVLEVDWPFFGELCRALALRVAREYQPEIVLGIAKAGVIPGVVVASIMQCDFVSMVVTREEAGAEPIVVSGPPPSIRGRRVLVVDETCDTGSTMKLAMNEVRALRPAQAKSAVSFKTGEFTPDFYAFETENFIILPWDREIIQGGELVMRPDYASRLYTDIPRG